MPICGISIAPSTISAIAIADIVDGAIEIPQIGIKHSLNVSVSAGILMWEMFRQFK